MLYRIDRHRHRRRLGEWKARLIRSRCWIATRTARVLSSRFSRSRITSPRQRRQLQQRGVRNEPLRRQRRLKSRRQRPNMVRLSTYSRLRYSRMMSSFSVALIWSLVLDEQRIILKRNPLLFRLCLLRRRWRLKWATRLFQFWIFWAILRSMRSAIN